MKKIRAAVVGYGNIGRYTVESLEAAPDFEIAGVVRRQGDKDKPLELTPYEVVDDITKLKEVDVAFLCTPTRSCPDYAERLVALGINTVDSFDIHTSILEYRTRQMENCKKAGRVSVIAAGWDPGSDSVVRVLLEALAPKGLTYTNFGPGMSMGHSVVARSKKGVKNALSMTIPLGESIHRRMVYVELEDGYTVEHQRQDAQPAYVLRHEHQQPGAHGADPGRCGPRLLPTGPGMLHPARDTGHRPAPAVARGGGGYPRISCRTL